VTFRERSHKYATKFITVTISNDNSQLAINGLIFHLNYQEILAAIAVAVVVVEFVAWWQLVVVIVVVVVATTLNVQTI
jgi:hypothetical protein